jgi:GDP-L-fucose synthase
VDCSIAELVKTVSAVTGFTGQVAWDSSKPDGAPRKLMDSSKLASLGWQPAFDLQSGLENTYNWFLENASH